MSGLVFHGQGGRVEAAGVMIAELADWSLAVHPQERQREGLFWGAAASMRAEGQAAMRRVFYGRSSELRLIFSCGSHGCFAGPAFCFELVAGYSWRKGELGADLFRFDGAGPIERLAPVALEAVVIDGMPQWREDA